MVEFAERMDHMKASDIRELLKLTTQPHIISFAGGLPAPELFPVEELKAATLAVLEEQGRTALQYGQTEGWEPLRVQIAQRLGKRNGIRTHPENLILTAGSQQGLDFTGKLLLNKGDVVVLESPSYLGAISALKAYEPEFVEAPTDDDGLIMEELEKILRENKRVKLIYVVPDFQNPSGRTWPLERRKKFVELLNKYGVPALEDNPYGDLRFKGEYVPSLKSLDENGMVIYMGTFSKILAPGYRLGWICADRAIIAKLNLIAQAAVLQTATVSAMIVSKYLEMYDIDEHIAKIRQVYKHRCELMIRTMRETFPPEVKFTDPDGGLFTWVEMPEYVNTRDLALKALEKDVAFVPGDGFFPHGDNLHCMRLNYSCMPDERIVEGVHRLSAVIREAVR